MRFTFLVQAVLLDFSNLGHRVPEEVHRVTHGLPALEL